MPRSIKVVSYNVNGILNPVKRSKILSKMKREKVGIAFLQETHLPDRAQVNLKRMGFKQVFSSSYKSGPRRGVVILIEQKLTFEVQFEIKDREGRYIVVMVGGRLEGIEVTLLNVYAPPGADWFFFKQFFDLILTKAQGVMICGGDLNVRMNPKLDSSRGLSHQNSTLINKINNIMLDTGLIDVWREFHPSTKDFTFFSSPHMAYSRIDYFIMFYKDVHLVKSCTIGVMDISDHCPVEMEIEINSRTRITTWRLN